MNNNIVNFPDNKIVREVTAVSFEKIQKFILYHKIAEECDAEFGDSGTVVFPNINCFEKFCEKLLESK